MKSIVKAKLVCNRDVNVLNEDLQRLIDEYNREGLIVRIEDSYSDTPFVGGKSEHVSGVNKRILVVGYAREDE